MEVKIKKVGIRKASQLARKNVNLKLDFGCGSSKRPGFIGRDLSPQADIQWDIQWGLPFEDNSVVEIRSDHFFEHLELSMVVEVLNECRRVLVSGGILDFRVPHFDPYLDAYVRRDIEFLKEELDKCKIEISKKV